MSPAEGMPAEEELELWRRYRETGDVRHRDALAMAYVGLARRVARATLRRLPAGVIDRDDAESAGLLGLIEAARDWDGTGRFAECARRRVLAAIRRAAREGNPWLTLNGEARARRWTIRPAGDAIGRVASPDRPDDDRDGAVARAMMQLTEAERCALRAHVRATGQEGRERRLAERKLRDAIAKGG